MPTESVMLSNHLVLYCPLFLLCSVFLSISVFSNESTLYIRWPKYWSFRFRISPFSEYSGLISFRIDWFDFLAVQETFKSLLQHHSLKASALLHSAFFKVQLSNPYMTTGKTIALTIWAKVMSLLFNMLSKFVIAFQGLSVFTFHGYSHCSQWFWSPRKLNLSLFLLPLFHLPCSDKYQQFTDEESDLERWCALSRVKMSWWAPGIIFFSIPQTPS